MELPEILWDFTVVCLSSPIVDVWTLKTLQMRAFCVLAWLLLVPNVAM